MQKKLCFVIRSLSGGGAERVLSNLANYFSLNGYKVILICLDHEEVKYNVEPNIIVKTLVNRGSKENKFSRIYYALVTFAKLMRIISKEQPLCSISFMTSVNLWTGLCCWLLNKPFIVSERTSPHYTLAKFNGMTKWIAFKIYSKAKNVVLPSKSMSSSLRSIPQFEHLNNLVSIYNPVNVFNAPLKNTVHHKPFVLSVGRLDHDKGFDLLIDAFYLLNDPNIDLLISGVGPSKYLLKKKVAKLGLKSKVKFIGFKRNLQDYYVRAEIFVLASRVEGYPNVLVEAMSLGCPVVATDCDFGPAEIIKHGVNGLLVQLEDASGLANAMENLLHNPTLRSKFAANGKLINQTNSIEHIAEEWEKLILL